LKHDNRVELAEFTEEEIINAFKFIDLDKNNFIGAGEIRHILVCMGELITDDEIDMMISMVDTDGDGQVSFEEFRNIVLHPNPAMMNAQSILNEEKMKALEGGDLTMAGRGNELDSATYQRQKEMQLRDAKKKMLIAFLTDHEYDFDSLRSSYVVYLDVPKEKRLQGKVNFDQFCAIMRVEPIGENMRLFGLFDEDRVGKIDMREFLLSAMNFVEISREVRLPLIFQMYDEDKTGFITFNEIQDMLRGNHMMSMKSVHRKAQTIMKQAVANEMNAITLKEFIVVSKKFPNIILPNFQTKQE
jgi:Ca2+-binding EF-hand superfamily protein